MPAPKPAEPRRPRPPRRGPLGLPIGLERLTKALPGGECDQARLELSGFGTREINLDRASLYECELASADLDSLSARTSRFVDVAVREVTALAVQATSAKWRNVEWDGGRLGSLDLGGATVENAAFSGVRVGYANLRDVSLMDVEFSGCTFDTLDLPGATLTRVRFNDCRVAELDARRVTCTDVDLRGLAFGGVDGTASLRGATVSPEQLAVLAPLLAREFGLLVAE